MGSDGVPRFLTDSVDVVTDGHRNPVRHIDFGAAQRAARGRSRTPKSSRAPVSSGEIGVLARKAERSPAAVGLMSGTLRRTRKTTVGADLRYRLRHSTGRSVPLSRCHQGPERSWRILGVLATPLVRLAQVNHAGARLVFSSRAFCVVGRWVFGRRVRGPRRCVPTGRFPLGSIGAVNHWCSR